MLKHFAYCANYYIEEEAMWLRFFLAPANMTEFDRAPFLHSEPVDGSPKLIGGLKELVADGNL